MICFFAVPAEVVIVMTVLFGVRRRPATKASPTHLMQKLLMGVSCVNVHSDQLDGWGNERGVRNWENGGYSRSSSPGPSCICP